MSTGKGNNTSRYMLSLAEKRKKNLARLKQRIVNTKEKHGLTWKDIAEEMGIDYSDLCRFVTEPERGARIDRVLKIEEFLNERN